MSRHQPQPTCADTAMWANDFRLSSTPSQAAARPPSSNVAIATSGLCQLASIGAGTFPNRSMIGSTPPSISAFGTRNVILSSFVRLRSETETRR